MRVAARALWVDMSDDEKHAAWCGMTHRSRAVAWDRMSERDQRMITSRDAIASLKVAGAAPDACGPEIGVAPARGRLIAFMPVGTRKDAKGQEQSVDLGYRGRCAARCADAFDLMEARRSKAARARGPLFDATQVSAARDYAALVERVAGAGLRGSSLETIGGGGGGDGGYPQSMLDDFARLRAMQRRIGDGVALAVRRQRPSARGSRVGIRDRYLVDQVCLAGLQLGAVAELCGWSVKRETIAVLRSALAAALDRIAKRA